MPARFESARHDRQYQVDAHGIAEFGPDRDLRQLIRWYDVVRIDCDHSREHWRMSWSVRAADGSRIVPNLEYSTSLECYRTAICMWRKLMPDECGMHFARIYRKFRWHCVRAHLSWLAPALIVYGIAGVSYVRRGSIPWEAIGPASAFIPLLYVCCVAHTLVFLPELRLDFQQWYARVEATFTEHPPKNVAPAPSSGLLLWLFPAATESAGEKPITDEDRRLAHWWVLAAGLGLFLLVPLFGYAWYRGLIWGTNLIHEQRPGTHFLIRPSPAYWIIPSLFLGIITSVIPLDRSCRVLLGDRYRTYERCSMERIGFDGTRLLACLSAILFVAGAVWFLAGVTSFSRFTEAGIEIRRPLSFRRDFYGYTRVRSIEQRATSQAPNGNTLRQPHLVILFDNGQSWDSAEGLRIPTPDVDSQIGRLVSERSMRPIINQP